jgi:hypothetical protein
MPIIKKSNHSVKMNSYFMNILYITSIKTMEYKRFGIAKIVSAVVLLKSIVIHSKNTA